MRLTRRGFIGAIAGGAAAGLVDPGRLFGAATDTIPLPKPAMQGKGTLMDALSLRKSSRAFSDRPIPAQTLSLLLWAAFGINRNDSKKRTAPSALNVREIDIYIATADGLYLYHPDAHNLSVISKEDIRHVTGIQKFVKKAPVNLIYVSDFSRFKKSSKEKREFYSAANTGFIGQNVYLFCAIEGLATVIRDWVDRPVLSRAMKLRKDQKIMLAQTIGYPASA